MEDERPPDAGDENDDAAHWHIVEFVPLPTEAPPAQPLPPGSPSRPGRRAGRSRPSDELGRGDPQPSRRTMPPPGQAPPSRPPVANSRPIFDDLDNLLRGMTYPSDSTQDGFPQAQHRGPDSVPPFADPNGGVSPSQSAPPFGAPERASTARRFKDSEVFDGPNAEFLTARQQFNYAHARRRVQRLRWLAIVVVCVILVALALWWSSPHWLPLLTRFHFHVPGLH
jgi:hypothetical protein